MASVSTNAGACSIVSSSGPDRHRTVSARPCVRFYNADKHKNLKASEIFRFLPLGHSLLVTRRFQRRHGIVVSHAEGPTFEFDSFRSKVLQTISVPMRDFPWDTFHKKLMQQLTDLFWNVGKFVVIPLLVITAFSELVFTVSGGKELCIPIGLLAGTMIAGILKETAVALGMDFQGGALPWHLVGIGLFFGAIKFAPPSHPLWLCSLFLHLANGGLWETIRYSIDWRRSHTGAAVAEAANQS